MLIVYTDTFDFQWLLVDFSQIQGLHQAPFLIAHLLKLSDCFWLAAFSCDFQQGTQPDVVQGIKQGVKGAAEIYLLSRFSPYRVLSVSLRDTF